MQIDAILTYVFSVAGAVAGLSSIILGLVDRRNRKSRVDAENARDDADSELKISAAWEKLNRPLLFRITSLEKEIEALRKENDDMRQGLKILVDQLIENKLVPRWTKTLSQ